MEGRLGYKKKRILICMQRWNCARSGMRTNRRNSWFYQNKEEEQKNIQIKGGEESIDRKRCRNIGTVRKSRITRREKGKCGSREATAKEKNGLTCFCGPSIRWKRQSGIKVFVCSAHVEVAGRGDYTPQLKSPVGLTPGICIISPSEEPSEEIPGSVRIQD